MSRPRVVPFKDEAPADDPTRKAHELISKGYAKVSEGNVLLSQGYAMLSEGSASKAATQSNVSSLVSPDEEWLTIDEFRQRYKLGKSKIRELAKVGQIEVDRWSTRCIRYRKLQKREGVA
jgi:hypothetical protein